MKELTPVIQKIKEEVSEEQWQQRIMECQKSGLTVLGWCRQNRIAPSSYYRHLRKIRDGLIEENHIVPIVPPEPQSAGEIRITVGEMQITLPETVSAEQFRIILQELKSC